LAGSNPFLACGLSPQLQSNYVGLLVISPALLQVYCLPPMEWLLCSSCLEDLSISELAAVQKNLLACYGYPDQIPRAEFWDGFLSGSGDANLCHAGAVFVPSYESFTELTTLPACSILQFHSPAESAPLYGYGLSQLDLGNSQTISRTAPSR